MGNNTAWMNLKSLMKMNETRPWGNFKVLDKGNGYKVKTITVKPGAKLSLQSHNHRSEHWVVVNGTALVTKGDETITVNDYIFIPVKMKHRIENPGNTPLVLVEVQTGEYLEEDDIIRYDDDYGRHENN